MRADIGLIGLAVMGQNLALNMADHGLRVAVQNRTWEVTESFMEGAGAEQGSASRVVAARTVEELVQTLERPRRIMLMVKAGAAVDAVLDELVPLLDSGDLVADGGNSLYTDTARRERALADVGVLYVGAGVSGGEVGARQGPSIMPGGSTDAAPLIQPVFEAIAARADDGSPCTTWLGPGGSGHFVKMVHNGIEYGDMQVLAEAYALLGAMGMDNSEMASVFDKWRSGPLSSYLVDITADILAATDDDGGHVLDRILDAAGQKGTGRWTVVASLELGQPLTLIAEAVMARQVSSAIERRRALASVLGGPEGRLPEGALTVDDVEAAVYGAKIVSYAQGFMLLADASEAFGWGLHLGDVAAIWRAGCIIRAGFLDEVTAAYAAEPDLDHLLAAPYFATAIDDAQPAMRRVVSAAVSAGVPVPAAASALTFLDGIRSVRLPANLIQAQRDYFGAHTYERTDRPRGEFFHTDWTASGGPATSPRR